MHVKQVCACWVAVQTSGLLLDKTPSQVPTTEERIILPALVGRTILELPLRKVVLYGAGTACVSGS